MEVEDIRFKSRFVIPYGSDLCLRLEILMIPRANEEEPVYVFDRCFFTESD